MPPISPQSECGSGESLSLEPAEKEVLATEGLLRILVNCPEDRGELVQTSIGRKACDMLDRWKSLGLPRPTFRTLGISIEEWLPEFQRFLDSL